jgi:hypothetical protein
MDGKAMTDPPVPGFTSTLLEQDAEFGLFGLSGLSGFLVERNYQINKTNQINQTNQIDPIVLGLRVIRKPIEKSHSPR